MDDLNEVRIRGRVSRDPEMRYTPSGSVVTNFAIATSRVSTTPNGERREFTDYHLIVAWQKLGEIANQLHKGSPVEVVGRLQTRSWDGHDGTKRRVTEVIAASVEPLELRTPVAATTGVDPDEVPF